MLADRARVRRRSPGLARPAGDRRALARDRQPGRRRPRRRDREGVVGRDLRRAGGGRRAEHAAAGVDLGHLRRDGGGRDRGRAPRGRGVGCDRRVRPRCRARHRHRAEDAAGRAVAARGADRRRRRRAAGRAGSPRLTVRVVCLPGDGIGPEVAAEAVRVLERLPVDVEVDERVFGGAAIDAAGDPLPEATLEACRGAGAVLLGAVGGPRWDGAPVRPEAGLIRLRGELDVYANLRPARDSDIDLLIVRELVGGLYFGRRGVLADGTVFDTCEYHPSQVERIARRAFELARTRRRLVTSVDKANVLDTSRLWRRVVEDVGRDYPDVELRHALVDSAAMQLVTDPQDFDVVVTENTFGDILS